MGNLTKKVNMNFPIILQSPVRDGFQFFRRINADLTVEKKFLGGEWEPNTTPRLMVPIDKYLFQMTRRLNWTMVVVDRTNNAR